MGPTHPVVVAVKVALSYLLGQGPQGQRCSPPQLHGASQALARHVGQVTRCRKACAAALETLLCVRTSFRMIVGDGNSHS